MCFKISFFLDFYKNCILLKLKKRYCIFYEKKEKYIIIYYNFENIVLRIKRWIFYGFILYIVFIRYK